MIVVGDITTDTSPRQCAEPPESEAFRAIRRHGRLRVIVNSYTPRLAYRESECAPIRGYEIDIAKHLAAQIFGEGFNPSEHLELIEAPNIEKLDLLVEREVDLVIANLTDTRERRKRIDLCGHYFSVCEAPLLRHDIPDVSQYADLAGLTVAVESGTSTVDMLTRVVPRADIVELDTAVDWMNALESGTVDAFIGDTLYNAVVAGESDRVNAGSLRLDASHAAIGVAKGRNDLRIFINECVASMLSTGQLLNLQKRWKIV